MDGLALVVQHRLAPEILPPGCLTGGKWLGSQTFELHFAMLPLLKGSGMLLQGIIQVLDRTLLLSKWQALPKQQSGL